MALSMFKAVVRSLPTVQQQTGLYLLQLLTTLIVVILMATVQQRLHKKAIG